MSGEKFRAPVTVKLDGKIAWNQQHGYFQIGVVDGGDLEAVRIGQGDLKHHFLKTESDDENEQIELLRADMERFATWVSSAATLDWPADYKIHPVFKE